MRESGVGRSEEQRGDTRLRQSRDPGRRLDRHVRTETLLLVTVVLQVELHRECARLRAEAADPPDDVGHPHAVLVQVRDEGEEVVLGLRLVQDRGVAGKGNLAEEVHLALLAARELLSVRGLHAAHRQVRALDQRQQGGVSEAVLIGRGLTLVQGATPSLEYPGSPRSATGQCLIPRGGDKAIAMQSTLKRGIYSY